MQLRVVETVFRAEIKRLDLIPGTADREAKVRELTAQSKALLERVRAELDGSAGWHRQMLALLDEIYAELPADGKDGGL